MKKTIKSKKYQLQITSFNTSILLSLMMLTHISFSIILDNADNKEIGYPTKEIVYEKETETEPETQDISSLLFSEDNMLSIMEKETEPPAPPAITKEEKSTTYNLPYYSAYNGFKALERYQMITNKTSQQYKLQQYATTSTNGFRMIEGRYCVAAGTYFNMQIGQYFDLILENGTIIPCILGDIKQDGHTDKNNIYTIVNIVCCSEFIVDINKLPQKAKDRGNASFAYENWDSKVVKYKVYDYNFLQGK